ncbi:hypothetical protein IE53DRAFT_380573 [Violaceomyces palustris]|uniref:Uncharacterized protein n=1 Tax=Violaceomyces palustris TaxID=1673888 RepID=A0ACD0NUC8_9BASI|nr:hypothetical protein IE53DRAFT_380573 [Violaceomyces palustris]
MPSTGASCSLPALKVLLPTLLFLYLSFQFFSRLVGGSSLLWSVQTSNLSPTLELREVQRDQLKRWWTEFNKVAADPTPPPVPPPRPDQGGESQGNSPSSNWTVEYDPDHLGPFLGRLNQGSHPGIPSGGEKEEEVEEDVVVVGGGAFYSNISAFFKGDWSGWDFSSDQLRGLAEEALLNHTVKQTATQLEDPIQVVGKGSPFSVSTSEVAMHDSLNKGSENRSQLTDLQVRRGDLDWFGGVSDDGVEVARKIYLNLDEEAVIRDKVTSVRGSLGLEIRRRGVVKQEVEFDLDGLHFQEQGLVYLLALPQIGGGLMDVRDILAMVARDDSITTNLTVNALEIVLDQRIENLKKAIKKGVIVEDEATDPKAASREKLQNCTLHFYGRLDSVGPERLKPLLHTLEQEMTSPTGISTISRPPLKLSASIYSPDCQLLVHSAGISGLRKDVFHQKVVNFSIVFFLLLLFQSKLLVDQIQVTTTPSSLAKLSHHCFILQSFIDACVCLLLLGAGVEQDNGVTLIFMACSFLSGVLFFAFEFRYAITIFRTQAPEEPAQDRPPTANVTAPSDPTPTSASQPTPSDIEAEGVAAPSTTTTTSSSAIVEDRNDRRQRKRLLNILASIFIVVLPIFEPGVVLYFHLPILYSFWIPQIHRNVKRGTIKALKVRSVVGITLCRLFLPLYFFSCPENILFIEPQGWVKWLCFYLLLQMVVLLSQDVLGPHFFLPRRFRPKDLNEWNWHPTVETLMEMKLGRSEEEEEEEAGKEGVAPSLRFDGSGGRSDWDHQLDKPDLEKGGGTLLASDPGESRFGEGGEGRRKRFGGFAGGRGGTREGGSQEDCGPIKLGDCSICLCSIEFQPESHEWRRKGRRRRKRNDRFGSGDSGKRRSRDRAGDRVGDEDEEEGEDEGLLAYASKQADHAWSLDEGANQTYPPTRGWYWDGMPLTPFSSPEKSESLVGKTRRMARWLATRSGIANDAKNKKSRRKDIMVSPCRHIFHTACLEREVQAQFSLFGIRPLISNLSHDSPPVPTNHLGLSSRPALLNLMAIGQWLTIKTECPSCRRPLPPV